MRPRPIPLLLLCLPLSLGCRSYRQIDGALELSRAGDLEAAADYLASEDFDDERESGRDSILWLLETAKLQQDAGRFALSEGFFEEADARIREQDIDADYSLSGELGGLLANQESRVYRAAPWEKILLESYRALNQLALGNLDEALVFSRRSWVRQAEAVAEYSDEIQSAEAGSGDEEQVDVGELMQQDVLAGRVAELETRVNASYADYANPFTSYISALLLWAAGERSNAVVDLRKTLGMVPSNEYVAALLVELEQDLPLGSPEGRVYVLFESGTAPERYEEGLRIFTSNGYSALLLPFLAYAPYEVAALELRDTAGELSLRTAPLADVNSIVAADLAARYPGIVLRTLLSVAAKEVVTKQIRDSDDAWGFALGTAWKGLTAGADLRTWRTPGAEFHVAHCERPPDGLLVLDIVDPNGGQHLVTAIELPEAQVVLLYCRSVNLLSLATHVIPLGEPTTQPHTESPPDTTDVAP